jgi:hypothetical protein
VLNAVGVNKYCVPPQADKEMFCMKKSLLIAFISDVLLLGCKQDPEPEPKPVTVTKNVTVTFAPFGVNPTVINLNPIYMPTDGWDSNFNASDIRFEIKDDRGNGNSKFSDGKIDISKVSELYGNSSWPWPMPLYTQIFYDAANNKLGGYTFLAGDRYGAGYFDRIHEDTNNDGVLDAGDQTILSLPPPNASPLVLQLSKTVTK